MFITAIVLAAGKGSRFKAKISKPLFKLGKKPVIIYSLLALNRISRIKEIILVVNAQNRKNIIREIKSYRIAKITRLVRGGRRRQDSVWQGLKAVNKDADLVLIHDGCRPFINSRMISSTIKEAARSGAAITGVPVKATIKSARSAQSAARSYAAVEKTLERTRLWEIQTPQVFKKELILKAYRRFKNFTATDDAMLVEKSGAKVKIVPGAYRNIKITTPEDLFVAQAILKRGRDR